MTPFARRPRPGLTLALRSGLRSCVIALAIVACGGGGTDPDPDPDLDPNPESPLVPVTGEWYRPGVTTSWQWQLLGTVNTAYAVDLYDIDLFDTPASLIASLQASGKRVICYFSAGSF